MRSSIRIRSLFFVSWFLLQKIEFLFLFAVIFLIQKIGGLEAEVVQLNDGIWAHAPRVW